MSKHGRVLVAMSGGIDSTVTAMMMHEQGYEVVGVTMKTWDYANSGGGKKETGCCSLDSINDARQISVDMVSYTASYPSRQNHVSNYRKSIDRS